MAYRPKLKICGVANVADARLVSDSGADYCGILVEVGFSERSLTLPEAREVARATAVPVVILLCNPTMELAEEVAREIGPHALQLLCHESPELVRTMKSRLTCQVWKTFHLPPGPGQATAEAYTDAGADAFLVDSTDSSEGFLRMGGTGKVGDWNQAAAMIERVSQPVFLAGGIGPDNVAAALERVRPYGIDLCSGVEARKGKKDPEKIRRLVENFRGAVARIKESEL